MMIGIHILLALVATPADDGSAADYAWIVGVNYIPSGGPTWDFLTSTTWNATTVTREVGYAAALGFNAMRIRVSPSAYQQGPKYFTARFDDFLALTAAHNISVMPLLFDTGDILKSVANTTMLKGYLTSVVERHVNDSRILGFDVCNECYFSSKDKDGSKALSDLHALIKVIRNIAPNKFTTTGMGNYGLWPGEIEQVPWVDVVSFHSYNGNQTDFALNVEKLRKIADAAGKPLGFASEVMNRPWDPLCGDISVLHEAKLGWFAWELMVSNSGWGVPKCDGCPLYQGILYPNGTAYNAEEVACIAAAAAKQGGGRNGYRQDGQIANAPADAKFSSTVQVTAAARQGSAGAVQWVPIVDGAWGDNFGRGSTAAWAVNPHRSAKATALTFEPQSEWRLESAGHSFLPWKEKPWRGAAAAVASTNGSNVTLLVDAGVKAVVMYYSTVGSSDTGPGGVMQVDIANTAAFAPGSVVGCVNFAAHRNATTHANRVLLMSGKGLGITAVTATIVLGGPVVISGFDLWTTLPFGDQLPLPPQPC